MAEHRVISRSEWGARHRDGWGTRPVRNLEVWLHHTVTQAPDVVPPFTDDYAAVRSVESIGASRFGGMSYTYLVTPAGLIFQGHSLDRIGAHTAGRNSRSIGVVLVGNYESTSPTAAQEAALAWLLRTLRGIGAISSPRFNGGHRDVKSTACPGARAYSRIGAINALAGGGAPIGGGSTPPPVQVARHAMGWPVLMYGQVSDDVAALQRFLVSRGFKLAVDRSYGPATRAAVREYQRQRKLATDGVCGPATQADMKKLGAGSTPAPKPPAPKPPAAKAALSRGSQGSRVRALQARLNRDYPAYSKLALDGSYGPATERVVREFQRRAGLAVDGVAGPATHKALGLPF